MKEQSKYVIIGNSTAAVAAIEGIRSVDQTGGILVIGDEKHFVYGRPLISYYLLGTTDAERMHCRPETFYEDNGVALRLGVRAAKIDPAHKEVTLSDGSKVRYEKLLVATGSRPFDPPMEGIESVPQRFHFMTMDDALALETVLAPDKKVLIVGAGLIGLKCLEGIAARVESVAVVDLADRILPSILDKTGADMIQRTLEEHGATFYLSDSVSRFDGNTAHLKSGKEIPFDILVVAVGVRPNTELVKEAGGEVVRGIVTDECSRTSIPDVYAAGDCAESYDIATGTQRILALLPNAYFQGYCAGVNMAGGSERFDNAVAFNAIGFFGRHVLTAGAYTGEAYTEQTADTYKVLFVKDNLLKGFILIDLPERAGVYTAMLRSRTPLSEIDAESLKQSPGWNAFPEKMRKEHFAKEV